MAKRGRKPKEEPDSLRKTVGLSCEQRKFDQFKDDARMNGDDPNRLFEKWIDQYHIYTTSIENKIKLSTEKKQHRDQLDQEISIIDNDIEAYRIMEKNANKRHDNIGYMIAIENISKEVIKGKISKKNIPVRAHMLADSLAYPCQIVIDDINQKVEAIKQDHTQIVKKPGMIYT